MTLQRELLVLIPSGKGFRESFFPLCGEPGFLVPLSLPCEGGTQRDFPDFYGPEKPFSNKMVGYGLEWTHLGHRVQFLILICHS